MKNRFIIDYASVSWTPEMINQVKEWAKAACDLRHCVDNGIDGSSCFRNDSPLAVQSAYLSLADALEVPAFPDAENDIGSLAEILGEHDTFNGVFDAFLNLGDIELLDSCCRGEALKVVEKLNAMSGADRWDYVEGRGMFGYPYSATLKCDDAQAGVICWGAKNFGCYISLSGEGCGAVDMTKLYALLAVLPGAKLTRVDVAFDDFSGDIFNVPLVRKMAKEGLFCSTGRPPAYTYIEGGHLVKNAKGSYRMDMSGGRSFYVGSRHSGKMLRVYEKGRQLKSDDCPNWVRAEVELRSTNRVLPLDILVNPEKYFAGAYPALNRFHVDSTPIKTLQVKYKTSRENAFDNAAVQVGKLINYMLVWGMAPHHIVERLTRHLERFDLPDRLKVPVPIC